jgi:glucose-6-phosphate 1-dehydrogenase
MATDTNLIPPTEKSAGDPGDACAMVIFGASGDLTKRKLIPALYNLAKDNLLSKDFALIGFARPDMSTEDFRKKCSEEITQFATGKVDPDLWHWFSRRLYYLSGDFGRLSKDEGHARGCGQGTRDEGKLFLLSRDRAGFLLHLHSPTR